MFVTLISFWSHMLAALLFTALSLWSAREAVMGRGRRLFAAALAATAIWAWLAALEGTRGPLAGIAESARNLAWLGLTARLLIEGMGADRRRGAGLLAGAIGGVVLVQLAIDLISAAAAKEAALAALAARSGLALRIVTAAGALVLVHNLYGQATAEARAPIRLPMLGLSILWIYDLNLYTVAFLFEQRHGEIEAMRGAAAALAAPLFALASRNTAPMRVRLSRAATFQSLSLAAILGYFLLMTATAGAGETTGWAWARGAQVVALIAMTALAVVLIPSGRARAWLRVTIAKHFFKHRYDYRREWLRFTKLMGEAGPGAPPLGERAVKAIADIVEAPAGLLMTPRAGGALEVTARYNWDLTWNGGPADAPFAAALAREGRIVDFASLRAGRADPRDRAVPIPVAIAEDESIWAAIPLLHQDRMTGVLLLAAPPFKRGLDWEDFDLLRTAARGAASYLAEAQGSEALAESQRFSDFNRRFAFILHDIKNLISGLSLVARNAERHAENPEFRADMVATLQGSVAKMNDLLAKLALRAPNSADAGRIVALAPLVDSLVAAKRARHDVRLLGDASRKVRGDPHALEEALSHLIDNAIDASAPDAPVLVKVSERGAEVEIAVVDHGRGMSPDFIARELFQPFASTKAGGFGIGAHQARALVAAMGARLCVESREGSGSSFTICLPADTTRQQEIAA